MLYASAGAAQGGRRKAEPDWTHVHRELRRPGVTLMLLWEEYRASEPGGYCYSRWCELYRAWEGRLSPTMRQSHPAAGERMFVDFDGRSGEIRQAQIFVAVMGASSYTYAEASWTQSLPGKQAEVLGGLGSILDAFWGGHLIGIVRSARPTWLELERAGRSLSRREAEVGFAPDSVLEQRRFELSVPPLNAAFRGRATWVRHRSRFRSCALLRSAMFYGGLRRGVGRRLRSSAHRVGCRRAWQRRDVATKREWRVSAAQSAAPRPRLKPRGRRHGRPSKGAGPWVRARARFGFCSFARGGGSRIVGKPCLRLNTSRSR
jgi:hypothetical protein